MCEDHGHSAYEIGAAASTHDHYVGEIDGAARQEDLASLQRQVEELTGLVEELQRKLAAEQEVVAAVRRGCTSGPAIVAALRNRSEELIRKIPGGGTDCDRHLAHEMALVASAIEGQR